MTRILGIAILLLPMLCMACGKYGKPVRSEPAPTQLEKPSAQKQVQPAADRLGHRAAPTADRS